MGEFIPYLKLLRKRGAALALRELSSRFFREDPKDAVRRVMDICERHGGRFTFFLVGRCAQSNPDMVEEILGRGHEVACHGYEHQRFGLLTKDQMRRDLEKALNLFEQRYKYRLQGFRAPYLDMKEEVYPVLADMGFMYSSSVEGEGGASLHPSGIMEIPLCLDDWRVLIKEAAGRAGLEKQMFCKARPGTCFLLHPWRVGQKRYAGALDRLLMDHHGRLDFPALADVAQGCKGLALSGDVGEFSLWELVPRVLGI